MPMQAHASRMDNSLYVVPFNIIEYLPSNTYKVSQVWCIVPYNWHPIHWLVNLRDLKQGGSNNKLQAHFPQHHLWLLLSSLKVGGWEYILVQKTRRVHQIPPIFIQKCHTILTIFVPYYLMQQHTCNNQLKKREKIKAIDKDCFCCCCQVLAAKNCWQRKEGSLL